MSTKQGEGHPAAIPFLKERIEKQWRLNSQDRIYRELSSLARIGGEEILTYLIQKYNEATNNEVKGYIIQAMGNGKMNEAIPFLTDIMQDEKNDKYLRIDSAISLEKITGDKKTYYKYRVNLRGLSK